ncbi:MULTISPECIES: hypothetical protein [Sutcliffiella]|uniref:Uncharacterized protein n=1 Tax=Sutcliffiella cohnii TaxID=33932 RepID=A0A223KNE9_9BACI|nr:MULTISPECIES: hypothetical protein [Sutcliffiella]AST91030.1 hypothetical protein BC6307_06925 [Sutcliffiella cohnii]WBL16828.1 hypothetical protein O1A01_09405 [Sutcliffiella sp. NC1]
MKTFYPRLKNDVNILETKDGLVLKRKKEYIYIKGNTALKDFIYKVAASLDGQKTIEEVQSKFDENAKKIIQVIQHLESKKFLHNNYENIINSQSIVYSQHKTTIDYISNYQEDGLARFQHFRNSKILIIGSGMSWESIIDNLSNLGMKELHVLQMHGRSEQLCQEWNLPSERHNGSDTAIVKINEIPSTEVAADYDLIIHVQDNFDREDYIFIDTKIQTANLIHVFSEGRYAYRTSIDVSANFIWRTMLRKRWMNFHQRTKQNKAPEKMSMLLIGSQIALDVLHHMTGVEIMINHSIKKFDLQYEQSPKELYMIQSSSKGQQKMNKADMINMYKSLVDPAIGLFIEFNEVKHNHFPYNIYELKHGEEYVSIGASLSEEDAQLYAFTTGFKHHVTKEYNQEGFSILETSKQRLYEKTVQYHVLTKLKDIVKVKKTLPISDCNMSSEAYFILRSLQMRFQEEVHIKYVNLNQDLSPALHNKPDLFYIHIKAKINEYFLLSDSLQFPMQEILERIYLHYIVEGKLSNPLQDNQFFTELSTQQLSILESMYLELTNDSIKENSLVTTFDLMGNEIHISWMTPSTAGVQI